jgi:5'-nucleotidase
LIDSGLNHHQDINLAKSLGARVSPDVSQHGVDLILGGHDHLYYVGKATTEWEAYEVDASLLGTDGDDGVLVIKSGSDFRDLSSMVLELEDAPGGSVRRKVIKKLTGGYLGSSQL